MEKSDSIAALAAALAKAQSEFKPVKRSKTVDFEAQGRRIKYSYAPLADILEACLKPLSTNGLAIMQPTRRENGDIVVETVLAHSSGEWVKSEILIASQDHSPKSEGSALTYARRYALSSLLGIASEEDDDGAMASKSALASPAKISPVSQSPTLGGGQPTTLPMCGVHKSAMRQSKTGHWYCTTKDAEGHYCKYQVPKSSASPSPNGGAPPSDTQASTPTTGTSPSRGQPGDTSPEQPDKDFVELFGEPPQQSTLKAIDSPAAPPTFANWGECWTLITQIVPSDQFLKRASALLGKSLRNLSDYQAIGSMPRAWEIAQEIKAQEK